MMNDVKRRKLLVEHTADKLHAKVIQKKDILPAEIVVQSYFILSF